MIKYISLTLLLLGFLETSAQYEKIDSLQFLLIATSPDTIKIDVYRKLSNEYAHINIDTSYQYAELSYDLAKKNNYKKREALALISIGSLHYEQGNHVEAKENFNQSLDISKALKDTSLMARISNDLGLVHWRLSEDIEALHNFQKAYNWAQISKNSHIYISAVGNIGLINCDLGRLKEGIKYFEEAVALFQENNNKNGEAIGTMNIAWSYQKMKKYDLALKVYQKTIDMISIEENPPLIAQIYINIAIILSEQNKNDEALLSLDKAIAICSKFGLSDIMLGSRLVKTKALLGVGRNMEAVAIAKESVEQAKLKGLEDLFPDFYGEIAKAYKAEGNANEAFDWLQKYASMKDSLFEKNSQKEIAQLEISFQSKQKDIENDLLKKEKESQSLVIQQRTRIAMGVGLTMILLGIIAFQLFLTKRKAKRINSKLEEMVKNRTKELEETNKRLLLSNDELQSFAFIASHDLKEPLRNIGSFITLIKRRIEQKKYESLDEYIQFVEKGNQQMVDLVEALLEYSKMDFLPTETDHHTDISKEIFNVCELLRDSFSQRNVQLFVDDIPNFHYNPFVVKTILKNLIENAVKYNKSESPIIRISSNNEGGRFNLIVSDNGIGIAPEHHQKIFDMFVRLNSREEYNGSGMGLAFCKKILMNNGGSISVESEEGKGSKFKVTLPVFEG